MLIEIPSHCTVHAYGSSFLFPTHLPVPKPTEYTQQHIFEDSGVTNFTWRGGTFIGSAFDPFHTGGYKQNEWLPQQGVILFRVLSRTNNPSEHLALMDLSVIRNGAAIIYATGESQGLFNGSNDSVDTTDRFVDGIQILNCRSDQCGSFWWDYGWLWQISTWPTNHPSDLVAMADFFLPNSYKFTNLSTTIGSPAITVAENAPIPRMPIDASDNYTVSFYGTNLPNEIVRGKRYYLRDVNRTNFSVSKSYLGPAIVFGSSVTNFSMFDGIQAVYCNYSLLGPILAIGHRHFAD